MGQDDLNALPHLFSRFRPDPLSFAEARVEMAALPTPLSQCAWRDLQETSGVLDLGSDLLRCVHHAADASVINHTFQAETSHSQSCNRCGKILTMNESEIFRENLLRIIADRGLTEAQVSISAGLNRRAVTDIRERRAASPKLSTVTALAKALSVDPAEMMGLGHRYRLHPDLAAFLEQYPQEDQARFLAALAALPRAPS